MICCICGGRKDASIVGTTADPGYDCYCPVQITWYGDRSVGWICPKCGSSVNPTIEVCPNCSDQSQQVFLGLDTGFSNGQYTAYWDGKQLHWRKEDESWASFDG